MNPTTRLTLGTFAALVLSAPLSHAVVKAEIVRSATDKGFKLDPVPLPSRNDAATGATFRLVDGERDGNGGDLKALHDGQVPFEEDEPSKNFFFQNGSNGGRIEIARHPRLLPDPPVQNQEQLPARRIAGRQHHQEMMVIGGDA